MPNGYRFDALHWLRQRRVERQAALLSESAARTEQARRDEARAEAERKIAERAIAELSYAEYARLDKGTVRAGELEVMGDWRKAADAELELKAKRELAARQTHLTEVAAETKARRELGSVSNAAKCIDTHRSTWHAERAAARERSDEEAAAEQWTASHYPARRS